MTAYTVEIQASNDDGTIWQALHPAETVEDDGTATDVAATVAHHQNIAGGAGWRVRVWLGADADTGADPAGEYAVPPGCTVDELAQAVAAERGINLDPARDMVRTYTDQVRDDADLWHAGAQILTAAGADTVRAAIAAGYEQGLHSTGEDLLLAQLELVVAGIKAQTERRDQLVRALMGTAVARERIAAAANLGEARLYQIRDGRR